MPSMPSSSAEPASAALPVGATLRGWLDHLQNTQRLSVIRPGTALRFGVAAIANRLDGHSASLFLQPGGHTVPVISGLLSDRQWMAEAMGVESSQVLARFEQASLNPCPGRKSPTRPASRWCTATSICSPSCPSPRTTSTTAAPTSPPAC
ncbi:UbiD family decarboxylase [Pseudomonas sp. MDMC_285]|nr:UbiD family decarboxylase [Pseudomonas sp. MDMC_285]